MTEPKTGESPSDASIGEETKLLAESPIMNRKTNSMTEITIARKYGFDLFFALIQAPPSLYYGNVFKNRYTIILYHIFSFFSTFYSKKNLTFFLTSQGVSVKHSTVIFFCGEY
jgi:hypothetical protein